MERGGYQAEDRTTITVSQQNYAPIGNVDGADVNHITGWAYDQNAGTSPINIHIYIDGTPTANIVANLSRPDIIGAGGGVVRMLIMVLIMHSKVFQLALIPSTFMRLTRQREPIPRFLVHQKQ